MKPPLIKGTRLGTVLVVYICVWLPKSPCHRMLLCLCETLSVCLLCKGQRMAIPQTPLIPYHHIPSACLIGEDLGVKRIKTLLMCGCAYHYQRFLLAHLHFAIILQQYYISDITGMLPVIPIAKVTLFQHTVSTKMYAHTPSTFKICVSLVFSPQAAQISFHHLTRTLTNLSTQWGHLRMIIRACVNGPRALVIYTHGRRIKKVMFHSPAFLGIDTLELSDILPI